MMLSALMIISGVMLPENLLGYYDANYLIEK